MILTIDNPIHSAEGRPAEVKASRGVAGSSVQVMAMCLRQCG
jgi:hypothetical protein